MSEQSISIRELEQNASAAVSRAAAGELLVITDHGSPVARLVPLYLGRTSELVTAEIARVPRARLTELARPSGTSTTALTEALARDREDHRY